MFTCKELSNLFFSTSVKISSSIERRHLLCVIPTGEMGAPSLHQQTLCFILLFAGCVCFCFI